MEWLKLRTHNGSVNNAFEELVCQLARAEKNPLKENFTRVAAPDGGVEAYVTNKGGTEYGWQAKFFTSMDSVQWKQIEESFKTAFEKHLHLVRYYICLPLDRSDPRIVISKGKRKGQKPKSLMDNWNDKVEEWKKWANSQGRNIDFEYWGSSELFDRLTKAENAGKLCYWFNKEEFTDEWFQNRISESITSLDKRYTPELNFNLPIAKVFDGISRNDGLLEQFLKPIDAILKEYNVWKKRSRIDSLGGLNKELDNLISELGTSYQTIDFKGAELISTERISQVLSDCNGVLDNAMDVLYDLADEETERSKKDIGYKKRDYYDDISYLRKLKATVIKMVNFLGSETMKLVNSPFLVLKGDAGIGKSHLLADIVVNRTKNGMPSILLLGQHFINDEPWSQIKKVLHHSYDRDQFLAALNSKSESLQTRTIIFIDAINEGDGKSI